MADISPGILPGLTCCSPLGSPDSARSLLELPFPHGEQHDSPPRIGGIAVCRLRSGQGRQTASVDGRDTRAAGDVSCRDAVSGGKEDRGPWIVGRGTCDVGVVVSIPLDILSALPEAGITVEMHDCHNDNLSWHLSEKDTERKRLCEAPPHIEFHDRIRTRIEEDTIDRVLDCCKKSSAKI